MNQDITQNLDRDTLQENVYSLLDAGFKLIKLYPIKPDGKCSCGGHCERIVDGALTDNAGKHPRDFKWQTSEGLTEKEIESSFEDGVPTGFGIVLGEDDLVIDVDCANGKGGEEGFKKLLEDSGVDIDKECKFVVESGSGAGSRHYFFKKDKEKKVRKSMHKKYKGIEFLTKGSYVVAYGSLHKSGGTYQARSASESNPEKITLVHNAIVEQIERKQSIIHDMAEQGSCTIEDIISPLQVIDPDIDYDEWFKICMAVHFETGGSEDGFEIFNDWSSGGSKYGTKGYEYCRKKWAEGDKNSSENKCTIGTIIEIAEHDYGWERPKLPMLVDMRSYLENRKNVEMSVIEYEGHKLEHLDLPEELKEMPGVIGSIMKWSLSIAPKPSYWVHAVGAIQTVGTLLGRDFRNDSGLTTDNYFVVVGESGCGKEFARKIPETIINAFSNIRKEEAKTLASRFTSSPALFSKLEQCPRVLANHDEWAHWVESVSSGKASAGQTELMADIMELMGKDSWLRTSYSTQTKSKEEKDEEDEIIRILSPCFSYTGITTPAKLEPSINRTLVQDGFLNRFMVVFPEEKYRRYKRPKGTNKKPIPYDVKCWYEQITMRLAATNGLAHPNNMNRDDPFNLLTPVVIEFDDDADEYLDNYQEIYADIADSVENIGLNDIMTRSYMFALKLATLFALAKDPLCEKVDLESAKMAAKFVEYVKKKELEYYKLYLSSNKYEKSVKDVVKHLHDKKHLGLSEGEIKNLPCMINRKKREREEIMETLFDQGSVVKVKLKTGGKGRNPLRIILSQFLDNPEVERVDAV